MNEEKFSSNPVDTLITFVGVRDYLVTEFLKPYLIDKTILLKKIVFFSSYSDNDNDSEYHNKSKLLLDNLLKDVASRRPGILIEVKLLENIWDIRLFLAKLKEIKAHKASINLTAGPSSFSIASLLWAVENGHYIEHSVESNNKFTGRIVVFRRINIIPYFKSLFFLDKIDRTIISCLKEGSKTTKNIRFFLNNENNENLTLRTVEYRVAKLNEMGIVSVTKGRNNYVDLSDDYKNVSFV